MQNPIHQIRDFYTQTVAELGKCTWPTRQELIESTMVVIVTVILLSLYVTGVDFLCTEVIKYLATSTR